MSSFICSNIQAIINSIGIVFDIIGAWFVAWEVVEQFKGSKNYALPVLGGAPTVDTPEFKDYEKKKYKKMKCGLWFLTFGFIFQLISNWILKFDAVMELCQAL